MNSDVTKETEPTFAKLGRSLVLIWPSEIATKKAIARHLRVGGFMAYYRRASHTLNSRPAGVFM